MGRGVRLAVVVAILVGSAGFAALVIRWAADHPSEFQFGLGLSFVAFGVGPAVLHLTAGDQFLRRHFGVSGAGRVRRAFRSGWAGVLLGAAMLGLHYLDRQAEAVTAEAQVQAALGRGDTPPPRPGTGRGRRTPTRRRSGWTRRARRPARRGSAYLHLGEFDRALADLDGAARLAPADAGVVYNRGLARARLGDDAGALADFSEAVRLDPGLARAYQARAVGPRPGRERRPGRGGLAAGR